MKEESTFKFMQSSQFLCMIHFILKLNSPQTLPLKQELVILGNTTICVWSYFWRLWLMLIELSLSDGHEIQWLLFLKILDAPCRTWEGGHCPTRPWLSLRAEHKVGMFVETCMHLTGWEMHLTFGECSVVCLYSPGPCSMPRVWMTLRDALN